MGWLQGRRRKEIDPAAFIRAVLREVSARSLARLLKVSDRTVRGWASGRCWCDVDTLHQLVDALYPDRGALPLYSPEMAIDGKTRVGGVGEFTLRAAKGTCTKEDFTCLD